MDLDQVESEIGDPGADEVTGLGDPDAGVDVDYGVVAVPGEVEHRRRVVATREQRDTSDGARVLAVGTIDDVDRVADRGVEGPSEGR